MKTKLIVNAMADGGGVNAGENGSVEFTLKDGRNPKQYYGLAVARLNRLFDWGAPWKVESHEIKPA